MFPYNKLYLIWSLARHRRIEGLTPVSQPGAQPKGRGKEKTDKLLSVIVVVGQGTPQNPT